MNAIPPPQAIAEIFSGVTDTMVGMKFRIAEKTQGPWFCTAIVPIPGDKPVAVAVSADVAACRALAAAMFGCSEADLDDTMLQDAIAELTNVMAGQLRVSMGANNQALGLPHILTGGDQGAEGTSGPWRRFGLQSGSLQLVLAVTNASETVQEYT